MSVAALLGRLHDINASINFFTQKQILLGSQSAAAEAKVAHYQGQQEAYDKAYDKVLNSSSQFVYGNCVIAKTADGVGHTEAEAARYAAAVTHVDPDYVAYQIECLTEADCIFDAEKIKNETLLTEYNAQKESVQQLLQTEAQDNHTIGGK